MNEQYLDDALSAPYGIVIECHDVLCANRLRRALYRTRDKNRRQGNDKYERLSFLLKENEIHIVKHEFIAHINTADYRTRALEFSEIPCGISIRGVNRPPLSSIFLHFAMVKEAQKLGRQFVRDDENFFQPNIAKDIR